MCFRAYGFSSFYLQSCVYSLLSLNCFSCIFSSNVRSTLILVSFSFGFECSKETFFSDMASLYHMSEGIEIKVHDKFLSSCVECAVSWVCSSEEIIIPTYFDYYQVISFQCLN